MTFNRDYLETVADAFEGHAARLRAMLAAAEPPPEAEGRAELERIYAECQTRRLLLYVYDPKHEPGAWRKAIGCAPRAPGEVSAAEAIRKVRGG